MGFPWAAASFRTFLPALVWGPPWAAGGSLLHYGPPWAAGSSLSQHGLHKGLQGNLCFGTWSTSSPSFFTDLGVCRVAAVAQQILPLLKNVFTELLPLSLSGSALASGRSILELAGIDFIRHGAQFCCLLVEAAAAAPLLPGSCNVNCSCYLWFHILLFRGQMISAEDCEFIQRFEQKRNPEEKQELLQTEGNQVTFLFFWYLTFGEEDGRKFSYQFLFYCWLHTV